MDAKKSIFLLQDKVSLSCSTKFLSGIFLIGLFLLLTSSVYTADPIVTRDLPVSATADSAFTVTLSMDVIDEINPPASVSVAETYPSSWIVSHISTGGVNTINTITWSCSDPDVVDQDFTYIISVPSGASGTASFTGSVDRGSSPYPIVGDTEVSITASTTSTTITTTTLEPAKVIMTHINYMVCTLLTVIWYIAGAITAIVIVLAGTKYITSNDPVEVNKAKNRVVYAVTGLILVVVACPLVNYLVVNTDITPFEDSCPCLIGNVPTTTSTTISGATTSTTISGATTSTTISGATTSTTISGATTSTTISGATTTSTTIVAVPVCLDEDYACTRNNACSTACAGTPTCRDDINNNDIADIDEFCGVLGFKECCCDQGLGPCCCGPLI